MFDRPIAEVVHVGRVVVVDLARQGSLFALGEVEVDAGFAGCARVELGDGAWVEHVPGWLRGSDEVMDELIRIRRWAQRDVVMYDRELPEPRLTSWWSVGRGPEPLPVLARARAVLSARYRRRFDSIGFNLYRDGHDSVAWHRDRVRDRSDATIAILSVGSPRRLALRPYGGGRSLGWDLGHGTLLVMGGTCQEHWEHAVPKSARVTQARMSITFRHGALGRWRGRSGR